jgi:hypothetical protein
MPRSISRAIQLQTCGISCPRLLRSSYRRPWPRRSASATPAQSLRYLCAWPRTDSRRQAHRCGDVGRLPDATPDVDCRGNPPRSEARLAIPLSQLQSAVDCYRCGFNELTPLPRRTRQVLCPTYAPSASEQRLREDCRRKGTYSFRPKVLCPEVKIPGGGFR